MQQADLQAHWQHIYETSDDEELSWFETVPSLSLDLLLAPSLSPDMTIVDVGGGSSRLVDSLLDRGFTDVTVLDISDAALERSKRRLGERADSVHWVVADVVRWEPSRKFAAWHDRALFHFLTTNRQRWDYRSTMENAVLPGGIVVIGTFSTFGPERCSGLPVQRYSAMSLAEELGDRFRWTATRKMEHRTPADVMQHFQFSRFVRE